MKRFSVFGLREVDVEEGAAGVGDTFDVVEVEVELALALVVDGLGCAVDAGTLVLLDDAAVGSDLIPVPVEAGDCFACARCN